MVTTVTIPGRFTLQALYPFARTVVKPDGYPVDNQIMFDFSQLHFIDGSGLTVFCNTLEWLGSHGVACSFANHAVNKSDAISYLDDCGFFKTYLNAPLRPHCSVRGTTLPFTRVAHAEAHGWLESRFTPWMSYTLGTPAGSLASVRTCVKEIFNNILDHSTQQIGYAHVQHYPRMNLIKITVSDFGRGIPNSIREKYGPMNDAAAVLLASQDGVSSRSTPRNQGIGLDFLVDSVTGNHGWVSIHSFQGSLMCAEGVGGGAVRSPTLGRGSYPGTLVDIALRTDRFVGDEIVREDVAW